MPRRTKYQKAGGGNRKFKVGNQNLHFSPIKTVKTKAQANSFIKQDKKDKSSYREKAKHRTVKSTKGYTIFRAYWNSKKKK